MTIIHVLYSPEPPSLISNSDQVIEVVDGSPVEITCLALGFPTPSFMWYHNGVEITSGGVIHIITEISDGDIVNSTLIIETVSYAEHHGTYNCMARSVEGMEIALIELVIKCEFLLPSM